MGLSLSLLLSAWNEILRHKFFVLTDAIQTVIMRTPSFDGYDRDKALRTTTFHKEDSEILNNSNESDKIVVERSMSFRNEKFQEADLKKNSSHSISSMGKKPQIQKPTLLLPEPAVIFFSPKPTSELDAAATTLQKVYKSYRIRRNLADCAVVVEELWWKALDSAALKRSSVSFFDTQKPETASSRWARARTRAAKVGKGLSKDEKAQKLALQHWLEAIDPRHRYGHNLHFYYDVWSDSKSTQPFFYWLDVGDGKDLTLERCLRTDLQRQCIKYLGPKEREAYEVIVEGGKLVYRQTGMLVNTDEVSKWIFVLSTWRSLYVGQKKKGVFQHSSFLSGGATTAAGRLVAHDGVLEAIWPYSGHYLPTEDNFKEFISFLEEHQVDLTNVKRCAIEDDYTSFKRAAEESKPEEVKVLSTTTMSIDTKADQDKSFNIPNAEELFNPSKRMSCKWTSPVGPRIGCVRDYPIELQSQALEQVKLSPKVSPGRSGNCVPIPSPRPSPKIRVSPRLAYMGFPSPRVLVNATK
ncbi:IQ domain-containing protein IQM1-like [Carya illinoinensis]|uniref:IQ domain-containing protein IQM1-like n=1 Tax=Carya illinoinensis TaxID=32201 RepID=A0A8T1N5Z7_CARIL|nr:IQ domain-containing protein IQM1-like [Carya illinoinensis]KAG6624447.1 hypothetical protein CIPAW_16G027500 [Carya illinoinensis]